MSTGNTVQVIGAVVDVEFPAGQIPKVYDALIIDDAEITLEVQQQLGDRTFSRMEPCLISVN